jgi:MFS family permease
MAMLTLVEVLGQVTVGLICDRIGRKTAMVSTTLLIVLGGILSTAASGKSEYGY